jgi:TIR domain
MDVDSIELGVDFVDALERSLNQCKVLIAVIGDRWLTAKDSYGSRRLDDPDDLVRVEIEAALQREIRVIPIIVDDAHMPQRVDFRNPWRH